MIEPYIGVLLFVGGGACGLIGGYVLRGFSGVPDDIEQTEIAEPIPVHRPIAGNNFGPGDVRVAPRQPLQSHPNHRPIA